MTDFSGHIIPDRKMKIHFRDILTRNINLIDMTDTQPIFMRHPDVINRHGIKPHDFGRNRIDGDTICTG